MGEQTDERRRFQRLELAVPIPAKFGGIDVRLLEVGLVGAYIEHDDDFEIGRAGVLRFSWQSELLSFECRVARKQAGADSSHSYAGLEVIASLGNSDRLLRRLIAEHAARVIAAQEANAFGNRDENRIDGDHTLTALGSARRVRESGFISWRFRNGAWKKTAALLPDQPADGFTVAAWEEDEQLEHLRKAYETADDEGRRFLRMLAELSIGEAKGIPPKKEE